MLQQIKKYFESHYNDADLPENVRTRRACDVSVVDFT